MYGRAVGPPARWRHARRRAARHGRSHSPARREKPTGGTAPRLAPDLAATRAGNEERLLFANPIVRLIIERADALISILAPQNTRSLSGIDPEKMAIAGRAGEEVMLGQGAPGGAGGGQYQILLVRQGDGH